MAALTSSSVTLARDVTSLMLTKISDYSVIQRLSAATPVMFKDTTHMVFSSEPEAEFVTEGAAKASMQPSFTPVPAAPHKAQVTVRMTDELRWADEDNRLEIVSNLVSSGARALGRALDYGIIHAVSPNTGAGITGLTSLLSAIPAANKVTATADPAADLDSITEKVNEDYEINGIAIAKSWANMLRKKRDPQTGIRWYPEIPLSLRLGNIEGIPAAASSTVNGAKVATTSGGSTVYGTPTLAIVGNWDLIKWGVVRNMGLDIIDQGDPDGLGDLKRYNQVAYRLEIVYNWAVLDPSGFAVLNASA